MRVLSRDFFRFLASHLAAAAWAVIAFALVEDKFWRIVLAILTAGFWAFLLFRRYAASWEALKRVIRRRAQGERGEILESLLSGEMESLASETHRMAEALHGEIAALSARADEQAALLSSMTEGVVALDAEQNILGANRAAAELLNASPDALRAGRSLAEAVRNPALLKFASEALVAGHGVSEADIVAASEDGEERFLQAHGTALRDPDGSRRGIGALVVLNDVTRLRRLENMRRDFVANVSHELKTPITSVKGFVETLRDAPPADPAEARRFLDIIFRQADRLNAIVGDLLSLSRIEQEAERGTLAREDAALLPVLEAAAESCRAGARARGVRVEVACSSDLRARVNAALLEQAAANLVSNAVKYGREGGQVRVEALREAGGEIAVRVTDDGPGIAPEHLPRVFERFYRADKARSRQSGGTGLGLAIVKHIVQAHGGRVAVESVPGKGCVFSVYLPAESHP